MITQFAEQLKDADDRGSGSYARSRISDKLISAVT